MAALWVRHGATLNVESGVTLTIGNGCQIRLPDAGSKIANVTKSTVSDDTAIIVTGDGEIVYTDGESVFANGDAILTGN